MADEWKGALSAYIQQQNKDEVDFRPSSVPTLVTDLEYLIRRGERKQLLADWYSKRKAVPIRSETRAKLLRETENRKDEVQVDLQLHRTIYYEKGGVTHKEERIDQERLTLQRDDGSWSIIRVDIRVAERHPQTGIPYTAMDADLEIPKSASRPYLNREVLGVVNQSRVKQYNRAEAAAYADRWWNSANPEFQEFAVDCTNYISQSLFAGGAPINYTGKRESGWWYKGYVGGKEAWSYSWSVANSLERYLSSGGLGAKVLERPQQLELGDVIIYDWDGNGAYEHSTIVTAFDAGGMPLVNAHTVSSKHRYWDYRDSYAWTENTVYRFFHLADRF
ncbi:amidase domain-containing protein [Paenibacillus tuaregi]|uniref:amidase domain-containing protein n=1 Tax=Paenibacillus tuaregi TaxID=1816681 RepID=UPI0008397822|nr:amidase domain-containing protein [Paenibacillus tuaregi]